MAYLYVKLFYRLQIFIKFIAGILRSVFLDIRLKCQRKNYDNSFIFHMRILYGFLENSLELFSELFPRTL